MKQFVVILRGCMASGKTTIARRMRNFNEKVVWLKIDNFKDFFSPDSAPETLPFVHGAAIATLTYLLQEGFSVVMEGVFQNPEYIDFTVKEAEKHHIQHFIYKLEVPLEVLQQRDQTREGIKEGCRKQLGDKEIERVFNVLESHPYADAIELDTQKYSIEECIEIIKQQML